MLVYLNVHYNKRLQFILSEVYIELNVLIAYMKIHLLKLKCNKSRLYTSIKVLYKFNWFKCALQVRKFVREFLFYSTAY
jgi:hypothetical protein